MRVWPQRAELRRANTELITARNRLESMLNERDESAGELERLRTEVETLRGAADGAITAKAAEEGQLAKVIRSKEALEVELLQALKENEQLRAARHTDVRAVCAVGPSVCGPLTHVSMLWTETHADASRAAPGCVPTHVRTCARGCGATVSKHGASSCPRHRGQQRSAGVRGNRVARNHRSRQPCGLHPHQLARRPR